MNMYDDFKKKESDDPFDYLPLLVFTAFSIESYINSIGSRKIKFWTQLERLPWRAKIEVLHSNLHKSPEWGKDPLQFATQVFSIRDRLAHGKPEAVADPLFNDHHTAVSMLYVQHIKPSIFNTLDREWVLDSSERLYVLLEYLGSLYGLSNDDFSSFSHSHVQQHSNTNNDPSEKA